MEGYWKSSAQRRLNRRSFLTSSSVVVVGASSFALVGCGDDDDDAAENGVSSPTAAATTAAGTSPAATASAPSGTLNVTYPNSALPFFNPLTYTSGHQRLYANAIGDGLLVRGAGSDSMMHPALAASHERPSDGLTWTFKLNPAAKFHHGSPVTAADVKFTYELLGQEGIRHVRKSELVKVLEGVDAPDDSTVVIRLKSPFPGLLSVSEQVPIISAALYEKGGADGYESNPVAAGPFKFVSGQKDVSVKLTAVDGHYRQTPKIKDYNIEVVTEEATRLARLQAGEADIVNISPASRKQAESVDGVHIDVSQGSAGLFLVFMDPYIGANTPLADARVRKALSLAINRKGIVDNLLYGEATLGGSWAPKSAVGQLDLPPDPYDMQEATRLLEAAGHADGFEFDYFENSAVPEWATIMVADWKKLGVTANLRPLEPTARVEMINAKKTPGVFILGPSLGLEDPATFAGVFVFSNGVVSYLRDFDDEMNLVAYGSDENAREEAWKTIQQTVYDETLYANLWYPNYLNAFSKRVASGYASANGYVTRAETIGLTG